MEGLFVKTIENIDEWSPICKKIKEFIPDEIFVNGNNGLVKVYDGSEHEDDALTRLSEYILGNDVHYDWARMVKMISSRRKILEINVR